MGILGMIRNGAGALVDWRMLLLPFHQLLVEKAAEGQRMDVGFEETTDEPSGLVEQGRSRRATKRDGRPYFLRESCERETEQSGHSRR
jgi:hypothetical protein